MLLAKSYSLRLFYLLLPSISISLTAAAICQVQGGTSDDGWTSNQGSICQAANGGGMIVLDKTYTIVTVLQTTDLINVVIQLSGTIKLGPGIFNFLRL